MQASRGGVAAARRQPIPTRWPTQPTYSVPRCRRGYDSDDLMSRQGIEGPHSLSIIDKSEYGESQYVDPYLDIFGLGLLTRRIFIEFGLAAHNFGSVASIIVIVFP